MKHNLYSLTRGELLSICIEKLFDRKDTLILLSIIDENKSIKEIATIVNLGSQAVYNRIALIKKRLHIEKWTDSLE